jgi:putative membrane protein
MGFARTSSVIVPIALGLAACSETPEPQTPAFASQAMPAAEPAAPAAPPAEPPAAMPPAPAAETMGTPAPTVQPLTDDQILEVVTVANKGEIEQARLAQQKAKDPRVKKFAAMMLQHHSEANQKNLAMAQRLGLKPAESETSQKLTSDTTQITDTLKPLSGVDFDRSYIDAQIKEHQAVLELMDQRLLPNAKNDELRSAIQNFRPKVEMHLREAQAIQAALTGGKPAPSTKQH